MKPNERLQAITILTQLLENKTPLTYLLQSTVSLSPFTKELCFGVCRHYFRLQLIADRLVTKRPKSTDVWVSLLIGLYQLHFLNIPDYAVVQETVEGLNRLNAPWAKGLVNAVLRRFCREKEALLRALNQHVSFQYGHPEWFLTRIQKDWPNDWQRICQANDERPPMSLRINQQQTSRTHYLTQLTNNGLDAMALPFSPEGISLVKPCDVHDLPNFAQGFVSVQDEAAQLAILLLNLQPGFRVLDACCAPGGKTCHILETEPNLAECIALDLEASRLKRVNENLTRLQLTATVIADDALKPASWWDKKPFDRILLDAPCSATGVIRRHPDIKLLRTIEDVSDIAALQHNLLEALWPLLSPGGLLVYATCSVLSEENENQIARFIQDHPYSQYVEIEPSWGHPTTHGLQILPGENSMDGFFYSVLKKQS